MVAPGRARALLSALALVTVAACVSRQPGPVRAIPPAPPPAPPLESPPLPPAVGWEDAPLTPGDWSYRRDGGGTEAVFAGADGPLFSLSCDGRGRIHLRRAGGTASPMTVATSFGERRLEDEGAGVPADATLLDELAFSRGRLLVRSPGAADLVVPAWPEIARVIEECRGR
jgi:hypothetical protein